MIVNFVRAGCTYKAKDGSLIRVRKIIRPCGPYTREPRVYWNTKPGEKMTCTPLSLFCAAYAVTPEIGA